MKKYVDPQLKFISLSTGDVVTASYGGENGDCYGYDFFDAKINI